jgi:hypothetical protein
LGAFFFAEGPLSKNTFGIRRSYNPGSFGMMTRLEMKGDPDLKRKRPFNP